MTPEEIMHRAKAARDKEPVFTDKELIFVVAMFAGAVIVLLGGLRVIVYAFQVFGVCR